jgi:hypothetical protein
MPAALEQADAAGGHGGRSPPLALRCDALARRQPPGGRHASSIPRQRYVDWEPSVSPVRPRSPAMRAGGPVCQPRWSLRPAMSGTHRRRYAWGAVGA